MSDTNKFCSNCGHKITAHDDFCANCGFKLIKFANDSSKETITKSNTKSPAIKHHHRRFWTISFILVILLVAGVYLGGAWYYGKDRQLKELSENITSGLTGKMVQAAVNNDGSKFEESELKPLANLFIKDSTAIKGIKNAIKSPHGYDNFKVIKTGKYFGFYPQYKVSISKQPIEITSNADNPSFELGNKPVASINTGFSYRLTQNIPGLYEVTVKDKDGSTKNSKTIQIPISGKASETNIDVEKPILDLDEPVTDSETDNTKSNSKKSKDKNSDDDDNIKVPALIGTWKNATSTFIFNEDGTYSMDGYHGPYTIVSKEGDQLAINFLDDDNHENPGWTDTFTFKNNRLELKSEHKIWTKQQRKSLNSPK